MRNPEFNARIEDWDGVGGKESMRQRLANKFGKLWQQKSPAEMLYEMAHWCDADGGHESDLIYVSRDTLLALAVYAGIREDDYGD